MNKDSLFDGTNYEFWSIRMQSYLISLGFNIWESFMTGYLVTTTPPTDATWKTNSENNSKSMNGILCSLLESNFINVMHCESVK